MMPACRLPAACLPVGRVGRKKWNWSDPATAGRRSQYWMKKVRSNPIIPVFQKHNTSIKALINNDIISILLSNSRYFTIF